MNDKLNLTGIENSTFGDRARIFIKQIILPSVPKEVKENPHNLPNSGVAQFVGRAEVLTQLHEQLQQNDRVAISTLTGMPGIGKSELALRYAWQEWPKQTYRGGICWLRAESDPGLSILSFAQIHLGLTLPEEGELVEQVRFVWQGWLKNKQDQTLIIFDDVRDYQKIKNFLPPQADQRFKVIITTRLKELSAKIQTLHVDILQPEAALDLLRSYVIDGRIDDQLEQAKLLCRDLGYLPLALELVARLLRRRTNWTVAKIREKLAENGLADQSLEKNLKFDSEMTAEWGVKAAFDLSWQELESEPKAQKLAIYLSLFAFAPFPKKLIDGLFSEEDEDEIEEWLTDSLVHLNLVKPLGNGWYELHTLIRVYLREKLEAEEIKEQAKRAYSRVMVGIAKTIGQTLTLANIANLEPYIEHLKVAADELHEWLGDDNLIIPFMGLACFYNNQIFYEEAKFWCEKCLNITKERCGEDHPNVAISFHNLSYCYESQGQYTEAEFFLLNALKIRTEKLRNNHPDLATTLNNLGSIYYSQGRYTEAKSHLLQAIRMRKNELGENHPDVARSLNILAGIDTAQGLYSDAESNYLEAIKLIEFSLDNSHPDVIIVRNNLALLYCKQKRYSEAEEELKQSLELLKEFLGDDHLDVAIILNNLANLYCSQKRYPEAEKYYLKAIEIQDNKIQENKLNKNHPDLATSYNNLANCYRLQENYSKAEEHHKKALDIRKKSLGDDHLDVATSYNNLALVYFVQKRYTEAESLLHKCLKIRRNRLGNNHPDVIASLHNLDEFDYFKNRFL
jgi:tetratricopeptide (TPR) repeat protein